jgi:hypothetical protein
VALDQAAVDGLMRAIRGDATRLAYEGFRTAQQTAWGLDALAGARGDGADAAMGRVFDGLRDPRGYDPGRFAREVGVAGRR